jgi:hypothetical protein
MTLEESHGDDIEATDDDDPRPPTPHAPRRDSVGRLSGDRTQHQLKAIVGAGKKKYPKKPCRVCMAHKKCKNSRYICNTCKVHLHKGDCFMRYHTRMKY